MSGTKVVTVITAVEVAKLAAAGLVVLSGLVASWSGMREQQEIADEKKLTASNKKLEEFHNELRELTKKTGGRDASHRKALEALGAALKAETAFVREQMEQDLHNLAQSRKDKVLAENKARQRGRELAGQLLARHDGNLTAEQSRLLKQARDGTLPPDQAFEVMGGILALRENRTARQELTALQESLLEQLRQGLAPEGPADWKAADHRQNALVDKIAYNIAVLEVLWEPAAAPFRARLAQLPADENSPGLSMRLNSLLLEVAEEAGLQKTLAEQARTLEQYLKQLPAESALIGAAKNAIAARDRQAIPKLLGEAEKAANAEQEAFFAAQRRQSMLRCLSELGYDVIQGMDTMCEQDGQLVLRNRSMPGYGMELLESKGKRMQMRAVAFDRQPDAATAKSIEIQWCAQMAELSKKLKNAGDELVLEKALPAGAVPLKTISTRSAEAQKAGRTAQTPKARERG